jgi:prolyl-tRNA synthetase
MFISYLKTYERLGLKAIPMAADTGPIGGNMSHEFLILAETGESEIACHSDLINMSLINQNIDFEDDLQPIVDRFTTKYAATDEMRNPITEEALGEHLITARGIEVGHIFNFGTKYSKPMGASVIGPEGKDIDVEMGSYGIGVSRLVGGIIEASHDENGIVWPDSVAPFEVGVINLKTGADDCDKVCDDIYNNLNQQGKDVIYDDRDARAGAKFADADLIGIPWQIIIGPRGLKSGLVELKNRKSGEREELSLESAFSKIL